MGSKHLEEQFSGIIELGVKLERVGGLTVWEAQPVFKHQTQIFQIQTTIRPSTEGGCGCIHVADISLVFPDGSEKRPDISIFCRIRDEEETVLRFFRRLSSRLSARDMKRRILKSAFLSI